MLKILISSHRQIADWTHYLIVTHPQQLKPSFGEKIL